MAGFSIRGNHSRSISLQTPRPPSRTTHQSDDGEKKLKNMKEIRHEISILTNLYKDIDEILGAPITQRAFVRHRHDKWVEGWLEESVTHLDICSTAREVVLLIKSSLLEIRSTLRRPALDQGDLLSCVYELRKMKKESNKSVKSTMKIVKSCSKNWASLVLSGYEDQDFVEVASILRGASVASNSIFRSILLCLQSKGRRWSLVEKILVMNKVRDGEMKSWDVVINSCLVALQGLIKGNDGGDIRDRCEIIKCVWESLMGLERNMEEVETEMESLFRCLIQTRVSFLNVLSH